MSHLDAIGAIMRRATATGDADLANAARREMRPLDFSLDAYLDAAGLAWADWSALRLEPPIARSQAA